MQPDQPSLDQPEAAGDRRQPARARRIRPIVILLLVGALQAGSSWGETWGVDPSFQVGTGANARVRCIAIQPDGQILIGGDFSAVNGVARSRVARLRSDGSLDESYAPAVPAGVVRALAVDSSGSAYVVADNTVTRVLQNGSVDSGFAAPVFGASVETVSVDGAGRVVVGGHWSLAGNGVGLVRLLPTGARDTGFDPWLGQGSRVMGVTHTLGGQILVAGIEDGDVVSTRLNEDGSQDVWFPSYLNQVAENVKPVGDGLTLFTGFYGVASGFSGFATLYSSDTSPIAQVYPNSYVRSVATTPRGEVYLGGEFTSIGSKAAPRVARLQTSNSGLAFDSSFAVGTGPNSVVLAMAVDNSGRLVIGGDFTQINGAQAVRIARLAPPPTRLLTVSIEGNGSGQVTASGGLSCPGTCGVAYPVGDVVRLTATAQAGVFSGWTGACSGSQLTCDLVMDSDKSVTATFTSSSTPLPPVISSIAPTLTPGKAFRLSITGSRFSLSTDPRIYRPDGSLFGAGAVVSGSRTSTRIDTDVDMRGEAPGDYLVKVYNDQTELYSNGVVLRLAPATTLTTLSGGWVDLRGEGFTGNRSATRHIRKPDGSELPTAAIAIAPDGRFAQPYKFVTTSLPPGAYTLWVVDDATGVRTTDTAMTVAGSGSCSFFSQAYGPLESVAGDSVKFRATATLQNCGSAVAEFAWDFDVQNGGTSKSTLREGYHRYSAAGSYTWRLTVTVGAQSQIHTGTASVAAAVHHFDIQAPATIGGPYTPFEVTITARDLNGNPVYLDRDVLLTSSAGRVKPQTVPVRAGAWTGMVELLEALPITTLRISGPPSGERAIDVGSISCEGTVRGGRGGDTVVRDHLRRRIDGATVSLRTPEGAAVRDVPSEWDGSYEFTGVPCGTYDIDATYAGRASMKRRLTVTNGRTITVENLTVPGMSSTKTPVILLPGILGSTSVSSHEFTNIRTRGGKLPRESPANAFDLKLFDPFGALGWEWLEDALTARGHVLGYSVFRCPYDWRLPVEEIARTYLKACVDEVKRYRPGVTQVDIDGFQQLRTPAA